MVERTLISLPSQLQLVERLQHLIYLSSSIIFVSGEAGVGKSTLTEHLSNVLPNDLQQIYIVLANMPSPARLRQQIVEQLYNKALFNAEDRLLDTITRLQQVGHQNQNRLIIIDNAENLPSGFVCELCELFSSVNFMQDHTFNILFVANELVNQQHLNTIEENLSGEIKLILNRIELTIATLSAKEASVLLLHHFQQLDYNAELQNQDALNRQLKLCHGNPKKITKLAHDLSQGMIHTQGHSWFNTRLSIIFLTLVLIVMAGALATYFYSQFIADKQAISIQLEPVIVIEDIQQASQFKAENKDLMGAAVVTKQVPEALAGSWDKFNSDITDNHIIVGLSDKTEQQELTVLLEKDNNDIADEVFIDLKHSTPETNPLLTIQQESYDQEALAVIEVREKNISDKAQQTEDQNKTITSNLAESNVATSVSSEQVATLVSSEQVAVTSTESVFTDSAFLLSKKGTHFTLQLSGMASRQSLALFKINYHLPQKNVFVYQTIRKNKPWFVILLGEYNTMKSALVAAKTLPPPFTGMPTWAKTWQVVHNDLRLNNE